jgi:hypothetical protein
MAEHDKSKARRPDLRTDPNNFGNPVCDDCNEKKGSMSADEYRAKLKEAKEI